MLALQVDKILSQVEIAEYEEEASILENMSYLDDFVWAIFQQIIGTQLEKERKLEAIKQAFGLLSDLSPVELEKYTEATRRRPFFEK